MQIGQWTLKIMIFTVGCFMLSYAAAVIGKVNDEKPYPESLARLYYQQVEKPSEINEEKTISAEGIREVSLATTNTDIQLEAVDGDMITVNLQGTFLNFKDPLEVDIANGKVSIKIREEDEHRGLFHIQFDQDNHLTIGIPKKIKIVSAKTVSGDIFAYNLRMDKVQLETVSGDTTMSDAALSDMLVKTVSGDVVADGAIDKFNGASVSGDIHVRFENNAPSAEVKTTSGDALVGFKNSPDVKVQFSSVSGDFSVDHAFGGQEISGTKFSMNLGAGKGSLSAKTVSGDVVIEKF